jgi:hypothetical protein
VQNQTSSKKLTSSLYYSDLYQYATLFRAYKEGAGDTEGNAEGLSSS